MHYFRTCVILGVAALVAVTPAFAKPASGPVTVSLKALNASGETGTATLTDTPKGVQVAIHLNGAPVAAQPVHIHIGTCAKINAAPEYPLNNIVNGTSTSVVFGVKLATLSSGNPHYAINVHKSTSDIKDYVSCGDIK